MPGVGPITAMAIETFAPPMEVFQRGRDFAAWLGLVPVQHSTGGKQVLGKTSKMGQRDIRRLLITGAMAVVRWACRKGAPEGTWLHRMLARKPRMLVAIALANKMARSIWAMLTKDEDEVLRALTRGGLRGVELRRNPAFWSLEPLRSKDAAIVWANFFRARDPHGVQARKDHH